MKWSDTLDPEDIAQERALAEFLGKDPNEAEREYRKQLRKYANLVAPISIDFASHDEFDADEYTLPFAIAPMPINPRDWSKLHRSEESIAQRLAYTRNWWRVNGKAYRQTLKLRKLAAQA